MTDLHVGRADNSSQIAALRLLTEAVTRVTSDLPCHAIILSGDITYAGTHEQYEHFVTQLLTPLRSLPGLRDAVVYAAPGNHDLDCEQSSPVSWEGIGEARRRVYLDNTPEGRRKRSSRTVSLTDYSKFLARHDIRGVDPLQRVSATDRFEADGSAVNIVTINTALFSDKERDVIDKERTPFPYIQVLGELQDTNPAPHTLVIGHHNIDWFLPTDRQPLKSLLSERRAIYLHGHLHELDVQFGRDSVLALGFGAVYAGSPGPPATPLYRNSFAICELNAGLHVKPVHWDAENGRWVNTTNLPYGFNVPSPKLPGGSFLPLVAGPSSRTSLATVAAFAKTSQVLVVDDIRTLGDLTGVDWLSLLTRLSIVPTSVLASNWTPVSTDPGRSVYDYIGEAGRHRVECIGAPGHVLSPAEVQRANTEIDSEGLVSYDLVTFGTIADDAKALHARLALRKPLALHESDSLTHIILRTSSGDMTRAALSLGDATRELIVSGGGRVDLLVADNAGTRWFAVVDAVGTLLPQSHEIVRRVRTSRTELATSTYRDTEANVVGSPTAARDDFARATYLARCHTEFNDVRYGALAAFGLTFEQIALKDLYIDPTGQLGDPVSNDQKLDEAIDALLDGTQVDTSLRQEMKAGLAAQAQIRSGGEIGSARGLYQQYPTVVMLGDPGSGKTCFVQREMLEYCEGAPGSWYQQHTPIYVPLSEVAALIEDRSDLIEIICELASRRGLPIRTSDARELLAYGRLALFFDGLDEIVAIDRRALVFEKIKDLVALAQPVGNRIVITSRPAAVQLVDIPKTYRTVYLRGLSSSEMRLLGERVLAIRMSEGRGTVELEKRKLSEEDRTTIDRLLDDCAKNPSIDRLARNPLFLSLLMMIYRTSGGASAKRHRIYQLTVQTLVAIRSQKAGSRGLSETDLRVRIGAVALGIFRDPAGAFPDRATVVAKIREVMESQRGGPVSEDEAAGFLQDVAEGTGVLVLHGGPERGQGSISFMHYSFLEYYAALGLLRSEEFASGADLAAIPELARVPRWREVISLVAGIAADRDDPTPIVKALLNAGGEGEEITLDLTMFAFDCALESDVPPDKALRMLLDRVDSAVRTGTARVDSELRASLGERLRKLWGVSNKRILTRFLVDGLKDPDVGVVAAYVDLCGHCADGHVLPSTVCEAFDEASTSNDAEVVIAVCGTLGRSQQLIRQPALGALKRAFRGPTRAKRAGARAVSLTPGLARQLWNELQDSINARAPLLSEVAALAIMKTEIPIEERDAHSGILDRALRELGDAQSEVSSDMKPIYERVQLEPLLSVSDDRLVALRLLPWIREEGQFVHDRLMETIREGSNHGELVASLTSLRLSKSARSLLRHDDVLVLQGLLRSEYRDVRLGAARCLGSLDVGTPDVVRALIAATSERRGQEEYEDLIGEIVRVGREDPNAQSFLFGELIYLIRRPRKSKSWQADIVAVMRACSEFQAEAPATVVTMLWKVSRDFATPMTVRRNAVLTNVAVAPIDDDLIGRLKALLNKSPAQFGNTVPSAIERLMRRCAGQAKHSRVVFPSLLDLRRDLLKLYRGARATTAEDNQALARSVRMALQRIQEIYYSYNEFTQALDGKRI